MKIHGNFMHYNNDENGVMEAKWDGNFEDGVAPTTWTGSVKILEEYMRRGGKPVKYGQCWVFAGIVTTSTSLRQFMGVAAREEWFLIVAI